MGAAVGDCNGDGLPDLLVTRFGNASLYINSSKGLFDDRIAASGILNVSAQYVGWGGSFIDFDNDGDLDVFIANGSPHFMKGMPSLLLENQGDATFVNAANKGRPVLQTRGEPAGLRRVSTWITTGAWTFWSRASGIARSCCATGGNFPAIG